jgi:tellurite resistance protein TehA-like permease
MQNKNLIRIILISVIVMILVSLAIPVFVPDLPPAQAGGQTLPQQQQPKGPDLNMQLKTAISFINIGLIIPLFVIYAGIYRNLQSSFTLGLLAVIFALGMYAVTSNPLLVSLMGGLLGDIGVFQIIPDLCTTIALAILIRISLE